MEYIFCLACPAIAYTGPHQTVDAGRNRGVGGGWRNSTGRFRGVADFLFEVLGGVGVGRS